VSATPRTDVADHPVLAALIETFGDAIIHCHAQHGDATAVIQREHVLDICRFLKDTPSGTYEMLIDECGVDRSEHPDKFERFEVVIHLLSLSKKARVRLRVPIPESDPRMDSLVPIWKGANWFEREIWDMYGIKFPGHPDLRRLLLYDQFEGHPLRKDYPIKKQQPLVGPGSVTGPTRALKPE
jgi:NADH-quinone oxidoreductase subunit C